MLAYDDPATCRTSRSATPAPDAATHRRIVDVALDHPGWGPHQLQAELGRLGHQIPLRVVDDVEAGL